MATVMVAVTTAVVTTGATVREAVRTLRRSGIEVAGIAAIAGTKRRGYPFASESE